MSEKNSRTESVADYFADHARLTIASGRWARIYAGNMTIEALGFEISSDHEQLAWIEIDSEGGKILLDITTIYAIEEVDPNDLKL